MNSFESRSIAKISAVVIVVTVKRVIVVTVKKVTKVDEKIRTWGVQVKFQLRFSVPFIALRSGKGKTGFKTAT